MFNRLYIHVPFCAEKCHYCAFVSAPPQINELAEYPMLLLRELQLHAVSSKPVDSIYIGGGTPSLLQPEQLARLLEGISGRLNVSADAEITLEANPGTVDATSLKKSNDIGINRISLGIQSFDDFFLKILGRIHSTEQTRQAFQDVREAGFENVSIDLMHSLPGQSLQQWRSELQHAIGINPEHISVYGLTVDEGTPFARLYPAGGTELADEDLSADMFELAHDLLTAAGFEHYEIANYARPGYRSQHNSSYWKRDGYLGLGVAAHSLLREGYGVRFSNPDTLTEYRLGLLSGLLTRVDESRLTERDAIEEYMFLGLRMADGIALTSFKRDFGRSLESVYGTVPNDLVKLGLLRLSGGVISLTQKGMLLSNQVFGRFII